MVGGRRGRLRRGHGPGHNAPGRVGAFAGRVPRRGQPRTPCAADVDKGLSSHRPDGIVPARPGGDTPVLPHRRGARRPHARPHQQPAGPDAHRGGNALHRPRTHRRDVGDRTGEERLPQRRLQEQRRDRHGAAPAQDTVGRPQDRPGAAQPVHQRIPVLAGVVLHQGRRVAGGAARCHLRHGRGHGHTHGVPAVPVQQVRPRGVRRQNARAGRIRSRPRHLQGHSGGARRPDMGGKPGTEPRHAGRLHGARRGRGRQPASHRRERRRGPARRRRRCSRSASSLSTTTRRYSGTSATRCRRSATSPRSRATRRR